MPGGIRWRSLPFGPCTSTASEAIFTVTPFGTGIGFFPIRDMAATCLLPDVAEDFAADAGLARGAAGHDAARGRQDVGAEAAEHHRHVVDAEVDAAAGTADALDTGDHLLAVRAILQE